MSTWRERADELNRLIKSGKTNREIAAHFGVSLKTVENQLGILRRRGLVVRRDSIRPTLEEVAALPDYKETHEILPDSSHKSDKLLRMDAEECKDANFLLKAHGFDANQWELVSARNNIYNTYSKQDGIQTLYSSKIHVRPRSLRWTFEELVDAVRSIKPVKRTPTVIIQPSEWMLEVPLYDSHFGVSTYEDYRETQAEVLELLDKRIWQETFIIVGQDLFHHDNFRSTTASGTVIQNADMPTAWSNARMMYDPILERALKKSKRVFVMYSKGNHDESMSWAFVQTLKAAFPDAEYDDTVKERKVHIFGANFIGVMHDDKGTKSAMTNFPAEFPREWAATRNREIHAGHWHVEQVKDGPGIMKRTLATRNKTDQWHDDNGFTGTHKRFQVFEWNVNELKRIHYV